MENFVVLIQLLFYFFCIFRIEEFILNAFWSGKTGVLGGENWRCGRKSGAVSRKIGTLV